MAPGGQWVLSFGAPGLFVASACKSLFVSPEPVLFTRQLMPHSQLHALGFWFCTLNHSSFSVRNGHVWSLIGFWHMEGSLHFGLSLSFLVQRYFHMYGTFKFSWASSRLFWVHIVSRNTQSQTSLRWAPLCLGLSHAGKQCPSDSFKTFVSSWEGLWGMLFKLNKSLTSLLKSYLQDDQYPLYRVLLWKHFPTREPGNEKWLYF